ncbi:nascent polypeptide-associated complex subunit alpha, muscle-specific form isoform X2 [Alosa sapidissima]|uniref:nascent polypeptide-associated complex subunit alpha, muscle-specific form isoform X2 n=1 Tax=Alosa sapidissima TaxID=34773 RepID=UPI001C090CDA|nr:nascent polypeptide-associated complex subunit alpha, muscle-specific form isoform X2 [Alosa sapidissima]
MSWLRVTKIFVFVFLFALPLPPFALRTWSSLQFGNFSAANVLDIYRQETTDISGEGRGTDTVKGKMGLLLLSNQLKSIENPKHKPTEQRPWEELNIIHLQNGSWNLQPHSVTRKKRSLISNGYQSDFSGHVHQKKAFVFPPGPDTHTGERWQSMRPVVECAGNAMTLTAQGRGYTNLLVDREGSSPVSLFHMPPHCGYNMKYTWKDLVLRVPYDGCYIIRENGSYVLPLLWWGKPVKISCPVISIPQLLCSPYGMMLKIAGVEDGGQTLKAKVEDKQVPLVSSECAHPMDSPPEHLFVFAPYTAACVTLKDDHSTIVVVHGGTGFTMACPLQPHMVDHLSSPSQSSSAVPPEKPGPKEQSQSQPHPPPPPTTPPPVAASTPIPNPTGVPAYAPLGPPYMLYPPQKFPGYLAHAQPYPQQEHGPPPVPTAPAPSAPISSSPGRPVDTPDHPLQHPYNPFMSFLHPYVGQKFPAPPHSWQESPAPPSPTMMTTPAPTSVKIPPPAAETPGPAQTPGSAEGGAYGHLLSSSYPYAYPYMELTFPGFPPHTDHKSPSPPPVPTSPPPATTPPAPTPPAHVWVYRPHPYPYPYMGQMLPTHPHTQQKTPPSSSSSAASDPGSETASTPSPGPYDRHFIPFVYPHIGLKFPSHPYPQPEAPSTPAPTPASPAPPKMPPSSPALGSPPQIPFSPSGQYHDFISEQYPYMGQKFPALPGHAQQETPLASTSSSSSTQIPLPGPASHGLLSQSQIPLSPAGALHPYNYPGLPWFAPPPPHAPGDPSSAPSKDGPHSQLPHALHWPHFYWPHVPPPSGPGPASTDTTTVAMQAPTTAATTTTAAPATTTTAPEDATNTPAALMSKHPVSAAGGPMLYYPPYQAPFPVPACPPHSQLTCTGYPHPGYDSLTSTTTIAPQTEHPSQGLSLLGPPAVVPSSGTKGQSSTDLWDAEISGPPKVPPGRSPVLSCTVDRLVVSLPSANLDSIQLREAGNSWVSVASTLPHCRYEVKSDLRGALLSSPLPACHSRQPDNPSIRSLPVRFWDVVLGRYRYLNLLCPVTSLPPPTTTTAAPTTPPTTTTTTMDSGQWTLLPPIPTDLPSPVPKPEVLCSTQHMTVAPPPGPVSAIVVKGLDGNEVKLEDAPVHCGYKVSMGKSSRITIVLPYDSCHVTIKGNRHMVVLRYQLWDGRSAEAQLSCPLPTPPTGPQCDVPSEIACTPDPVSASQCHMLGCCHCPATGACYYPMDECTEDGHFVFSVPSTIMSPPLNPAMLLAGGNASCPPWRATPKYALFKIPLDGCGAHKFEVGESVIYMVEILNTVQAISLNYGTITRESPVRVLVECRYLPGAVVSVGYLVKRPSLGPSIQAQGVFGVQLRIAEDHTYTSYHPQYHRPLGLLLGKPLYLEVRLLNPPDSDLVLLVHYCVAYPRSAHATWVLIYDGYHGTQ